MVKKIRYPLLIALTILLWFASTASEATNEDEARKLSQQALNLQAQHRWEEAVAILENGHSNCGNHARAKICRSILSFSLGYLYQKRSEVQASENKNYLGKAARYYRQALSDQPRNTQIMKNLALVLQNLGYWEQAARLFHGLALQDDDKRATYLVARGDLYRENDRPADAFKSYEMALKHNPSDETANRKLLSLYQQTPDFTAEDLFQYSLRLKEQDLPGLAKDGFEQVINRTYASNVTLSEAALLHWAELLAVNDWVSMEAFRRLPDVEKWQSSAVRELQDFVNGSGAASGKLDWWKQNDVRRHVAASVLKAKADTLRISGNVKMAADTYQAALEIAPRFFRYDRGGLKSRPVVSMNIALELASIYYKYAKLLDPGGGRFKRLVNELFDEKALYYIRNDLMAIQRSHTVLGLIYSEKGQWTSTWRAGNAIFQLDHALKTAKTRVETNPKNYQPLPHLQSLLAKGCTIVSKSKTGKAKADLIKKAFSTYLDASMGYMDLDDLGKADQMIEMAKTLNGVPSAVESRRGEQIKTTLRSREAIQHFQADHFDPKSANYYGKLPFNRWLFDPKALRLDPSFANRQRFKALSDLGAKALIFNATQEGLRLQSLALKIIRVENSLSSMQDIVRLNQIKKGFRNIIHLPRSEQVIRTGSNLEANAFYKDGRIWTLSWSPDQQPLQVGVGQDLILSGQITESLIREVMLPATTVRLDIQNGNVKILRHQSSPETVTKASMVIKNIEGVRKVQIK